MNRSLLLFLLFLVQVTVQAADPEKIISSKIENVTVFLSGAQVARAGSMQLPAGRTAILFKNISPYVQKESLQVKGEGNFTVLSVVHQLDAVQEQTKRTEITTLETQLEKLNDRLATEQNMLQVYRTEENMLLKNQDIKGQNATLKVADLKEAVEYHRARLTEVKQKQMVSTKNIQELTKEINKFQQQLQNVNLENNLATSEIVVTVTAKEATTAKFLVSYLVQNASWYPTYDVRVTDISKPISLLSKANVTQQSGENWNDVKLTLSTGDPALTGVKPELQTWNLQYYRPRIMYDKKAKELQEVQIRGNLEGRVAGISMEKRRDIIGSTTSPASAPLEVSTNLNQTNISFTITLPYSIPSNGKNYVVDINEKSIPALYEYYCVPKLDKDAFLTAKIINWEEYNLLEGEASLFFEGTFLGKTILNTNIVSDTLAISLGRDKNISVTRTKLKGENKKQFVGNNRTETLSWEISTRNRKNVPVKLILEDQIPVSFTQEIEVEKLAANGAEYNATTGKLTWRLDLPPGQEKKVGFKYSVKYPKNQVIALE